MTQSPAPAPPSSPPAGGTAPTGAPAPTKPAAPTSDLPINPAIGPQELAALRARRNALSGQLSSAEDRRREVLSELSDAPAGPARAGLEDRLKLLDGRILQIERDIARNGELIASAPTSATTEEPGGIKVGGEDMDFTAIFIVFTLFVLFPIVLAYARSVWRRTNALSAPVSRAQEEMAQRLARLETAVDTIAVEIERISEGQRFVSKVLVERPALGAGAAEPVRVPQGEGVEARRPSGG